MMKLFHGTATKLANIEPTPEYQLKANYISDFGLGFYVTEDKDLAVARALFRTNSNTYLYGFSVEQSAFERLNIFRFQEVNIAWLMFVAYNRKRLDDSTLGDFCASVEKYFAEYDVIYGPVAEDLCNLYVNSFLARPTFLYPPKDYRRTLLQLSNYEMRYQYVFRSQRACELLNQQLREPWQIFTEEDKLNGYIPYLDDDVKRSAGIKNINYPEYAAYTLAGIKQKITQDNIIFTDLLQGDPFLRSERLKNYSPQEQY